MVTDTVGDCLSRIRNALMAGHHEVRIPHSNLKERVVAILVQEGYLKSSSVEAPTANRSYKMIVAETRYKADGEPAIRHIQRVSTPGQRVYRKTPEKMSVRSGFGFQILSTSKGVMTEKDAIEKKVGGEVLAEIY